MLIPERYSEILRSAGRSLQDIGVAGVGLSRQHALDAVASLKGTQVAISGGDVLRLRDGRPRYSGDNWYVQRLAGEDLAAYVSRTHEKADTYIRNYQDAEDGSVLYVIVISELGLQKSFS